MIIQEKILKFIEDDVNVEENEVNLFAVLNEQNIIQDIYEFRLFLTLIVKICDNHSRTMHLFDRIYKILQIFGNDIKQYFSNNDIFNIFKSNKRILLILIDQNILVIDQHISSIMMKGKFRNFKYPEYFRLPCAKVAKDDFFEQKRLVGENDLQISEIIRNDDVELFISYVTKTNFPLDSTIKTSIFETNQLLLKKEPSLFEYCVFFGAVKICKFLISNNLSPSSSLWIYAIHSNNKEMIEFLISSDIFPEDPTYEKCLEESIKCHHTNIINYIQDNFIDKQTELFNLENFYDHNIYYYSLHYHNYLYLPPDLKYKYMFFYMCEFGYHNLVEIYLNSKNTNINATVIEDFTFSSN